MAGTTPIGGYPVPDNGDNVNDIGGKVAEFGAAIEKAVTNVYPTYAERDVAVAGRARIGMITAIESPQLHLEKCVRADSVSSDWVVLDTLLLESKAQENGNLGTPGALSYRLDNNQLSGTNTDIDRWPVAHLGGPMLLQFSSSANQFIDGNTASTGSSWAELPLFTYNIPVNTIPRTSWATVGAAVMCGTSDRSGGRVTDGGPTTGYGAARFRFRCNNQNLSPAGGYANVRIGEPELVGLREWTSPQRILLQEGQTYQFTMDMQLDAAAGSVKTLLGAWYVYLD